MQTVKKGKTARTRTPSGTIHRSIHLLRAALEDLGAQVPMAEM